MTLYFGISTLRHIDETHVLKFESQPIPGSTVAGTFVFSPKGYMYLCYPAALPTPTGFRGSTRNVGQRTQDDFLIDIAGPADDAVYSNVVNGYYYALLTVIGESYRVYRSKEIFNDFIDMIVY